MEEREPPPTGPANSQLQPRGDCKSFAEFNKRFGRSLYLRESTMLAVFRSDVKPSHSDPANRGHGAGQWTTTVKDESAAHFLFRTALMTGMLGFEGINGILLLKQGELHLVVLWTRAHQAPQEEMDVFGLQYLVDKVSEGLSIPLPLRFTPHHKTAMVSPGKVKKQQPAYSGGLKAAFLIMSRRAAEMDQRLHPPRQFLDDDQHHMARQFQAA